MKKNVFLSVMAIGMATALSVSFVSCGGDGSNDPTPDPVATETTLTVSGVDAKFDANVSSMSMAQELTIESNTAWGIADIPSWIDVDRRNGSAGKATVKVWPNSENSSDTERRGTLVIQAGDKTIEKTVYQRPGVNADLYVAPTNLVALADGFACDFTFGSKVKYYYVSRYLPSTLARKTDAEIIEDMSSDPDNRDTPSDGYVTSWQGQTPLTDYVICTVGYDNSGKHGVLTKTNVKTKSDSNQALATISDVDFDDTYGNWATSVNGFVTKYYMWFVSRTDLYDTSDACVAWFFKDAMNSNPDNFAPIAQGDYWQVRRNGGSIFHVVTWALDVDGNFSGLIGRFRGYINSSRANLARKNYVEDFDSSKRIKTLK